MSVSPANMNPFPGLRPFTQEEDYLFFGREEQTIELLQRLAGNRFVAVVGTSGSGKSSLVRCGLLSELLGGKMLQAGAAWEIAVTHPGGNPLALLTDALIEADLYDPEEEHVRENVLATLSRSHFGLVEAIKQSDLSDDTNFLLVVDQFEEIFRFHEAGQTQQEAANEFVSMLLEAVAQTEVPIYVVLTMRSDFIGECGQFEGLAEMVNRGEFLIPRLSREQYKRVIEGPIKVAGGQITPRLLQRLLNDLGQQADQLPCLQHALMRTWELWAENGDVEAVDLDDYQRVGRMAEALSLHADEIYASLETDRQRRLCEGMFQALTVQETENRGIRRPQRLGRLCQILEVEADELIPIIDAYRRPGVTFLMPPSDVELTDQTIIDISHESLMRVWTRLRHWVEEEAQAAGIYLRLSESASLHEQGKAGLYRDPELGIALAWREAEHPNAAWAERYKPGFDAAMAFLDASQQAALAEEQEQEAARQRELEQAQKLAEAERQRAADQARSAVRLRRLVRGLGLVAMVAITATVFAWLASQEAKRNADSALQAQQDTEKALTEVEKQKEAVERQRAQAETAEKDALIAKRNAEQAEKRSREFRYATDMQLAATLVDDEAANAGQILARLNDHDPELNKELAGRDDLRSFEWHYLKHQLESRAAIFAEFDAQVVDCTLTADGELVTLDEDLRLQVWNVSTRMQTRPTIDLKQGRAVGTKALSPDGQRVAFAIGNRVHVVDTATGQETVRPLPMASGRGMIFSPDSRMLVTIDQQVLWWDVATGRAIAGGQSNLRANGTPSISTDGLTVLQTQTPAFAAYSMFRMDPETREVVIVHDQSNPDYGGTRAYSITPDGKRLAITQMFASSIRLYDAVDGLPLKQNEAAHSASISAIGFNPAGTEMVTAALDGSIRIWNEYETLPTPDVSLIGHAEEVTKVFFADAGKRVISISRDRTVRVWDLAQTDASLYQTVEGVSGYRARFSPDGTMMAVAGETPQRIRDAVSGLIIARLPQRDDNLSSDSVAFSPDNRLLALGFGGANDVSIIELWDLDTEQLVATMPGSTAIPGFTTDANSGLVSGLTFSPDGRHLVASFGALWKLGGRTSVDHPLAVYDVAVRRPIRWLKGHMGYTTSVVFSKDGTRMASGSYDGTAILWDTSDWSLSHVLENPDQQTATGGRRVFDVALSPDNSLLAMASYEGNVIVWDTATATVRQTLSGHANGVSSVAFSPNGLTLASGSFDNSVRLWNVATGRELVRLRPEGGLESRSLEFSPDGRQLLAAGGQVILWSTQSGSVSAQQLADQLQALRQSEADFLERVRLLSETPQLREALQLLAVQFPEDARVQAALAAALANWHATRGEWAQAAEQFDLLESAEADSSNAAGGNRPGTDWLRTPGLLRVATALLHQDRADIAATLLTGGEERRSEDGNGTRSTSLGFHNVSGEFPVEMTHVHRGSPAWQAGLRTGSVILKFNDVELSAQTYADFEKEVTAGPVVLTVRKAGSEEDETVTVAQASHIQDDLTVELIENLLALIDQKLSTSANDPGLLELRAEIVGQSSDYERQVADYTAAIESLSGAADDADAPSLARLHFRRAKVYLKQEKWQSALDDFSAANVDETGDDKLDEELARARAEVLTVGGDWLVVRPTEMNTAGGARLTVLADGSVLASGTNPSQDSYHLVYPTEAKRITAIRIEALTHPDLPGSGPGRFWNGAMMIGSLRIDWSRPDSNESTPVQVDRSLSNHSVASDGKEIGKDWWDIGTVVGKNHFAVFQLEEPIDSEPGITLMLSFKGHGAADGRNPGRFRISVTDSPEALDHARDHAEIFNRLNDSELEDGWARLAFIHHLLGDEQAVTDIASDHPAAAIALGRMLVEEDQPQRAAELLTLVIDDNTTDDELLTRRAKAYEQLQDWDAAAADWNRAASDTPQGATLLAEFAGRLVVAEQFELAATQRQRAREILEATLQTDPHDDPAIDALATLLLDMSEPVTEWTVLKPAGLQTSGGAALALADDDSLTLQPKPHVLTLADPGNSLQAIRIETSTDAATPDGEAPAFTEYRILSTDLPAEGFRGRYVRIDLPGDSRQFPRSPQDGGKKCINLAEVQVFRGQENIALKKSARQSSEFDSLKADLAVDGDTLGVGHTFHPFAHTQSEDDPWWEVDLGGDQAFDRLVIWNRQGRGGGWDQRMNHFRIRILDESRRVVFERVIDEAPNPSSEITRQVRLAKIQPDAANGAAQWEVTLDGNVGQRFRISRAMWEVLRPVTLAASEGTQITAGDDNFFVAKATGTGQVLLPELPAGTTAIRFETGSDPGSNLSEAVASMDYRIESVSASRSESGRLKGHYVRIDLPGDNSQFVRHAMDGANKVLSLSEVQLFQGEQNLALSGQASQSTTLSKFGGGDAQRAIDGNTSDTYSSRTISYTEEGADRDPWWELNLGAEQEIDRIVIWNRGEGVGDRLRHFRVRILDADRHVVLEQVIDDPPMPSREIDCHSWLVATRTDADGDSMRWSLPLNQKSGIGSQQQIRIATSNFIPSVVDQQVAPDREWVVLEPATITPASGTTLTAQEDGSYVVHSTDDSLPLPMLAGTAKAIRVETAGLAGTSASATRAFSEYRVEAIDAKRSEGGALQGRYVRIDLPGDNSLFPRKVDDAEKKIIGLAEVQIFRGETNVALRKPARQSSTFGVIWGARSPAGSWVAGRAVDGDTNGKDARTIARTIDTEEFPNEPWWEVDLGTEQSIDRMVVWNWAEQPQIPRMNHFRIRVLNASRNVVFEQVIDEAPVPSREIDCRSLLAGTSPAAADQKQWSLQLGGNTPIDLQGRFRISSTDELWSLEHEEAYVAARALPPTSVRLAVAFDRLGETSLSTDWFRRALDEVTTNEDRGAILKYLQDFRRPLAELLRQSPDNIDLQLALARSHVKQGQQHVTRKEPPAALTEFQAARDLFTNVIEQDPAPEWTVLEPSKLTSAAGAALTVQPDGSVFVSGNLQVKDTFTFDVGNLPQGTTAIRLEALRDDRLPQSGPGTHSSGNFVLSDFKVIGGNEGDSEPATSVILEAEFASYEERPAADSLSTGEAGWSVGRGGEGKDQTVVFQVVDPASLADSQATRIVLDFYHEPNDDVPALLGRFRLSATSALIDDKSFRLIDLKATELAALDVSIGRSLIQQDKSLEAATAFARALDCVEEDDQRKELIEQFQEHQAALTILAEQRPQDAALQLALAKSLAASGRKALDERRDTDALPQLAKAQELFAQLASEHSESEWRILEPVEMKTETGAAMHLQEDGSIFVEEPGGNGAYTLVFQGEFSALNGLRLEALADGRLPGGGPGWFNDGNFVLSELSLEASAADADQPGAVALQNAVADFSQVGWDIAGAIDGNESTGWAVQPEFNKNHVAYFETVANRGDGAVTRLTVRLHHQFQYQDNRHQLGRFRLAATSDPNAVEAARFRQELKASGLQELQFALGNAHGRQGRVDESAAAFGAVFDLAVDREERTKIVEAAAAYEGVLARLTEQRSDDASYLEVLARQYQTSGDFAAAHATAATARTLYEQQLAADPANSKLARDLADLLLSVSPVEWKILKPTQMKSKAGTTLALQKDGSILATGKPAAFDEYTIEANADVARIGALRLESMTHESLPGNGPGTQVGGWAGTFAFNGFDVASVFGDGKEQSIELSAIAVDFVHPGDPVTVNGYKVRGAGVGHPHTAVYTLTEPVDMEQGSRLRFRMEFASWEGQIYNLGCFRLSVSEDPSAFEIERTLLSALKNENPWSRLTAAYRALGEPDKAVEVFVRAYERSSGNDAKAVMAQEAVALADVFAKLLEKFPDDKALRLGQAKYLVSKHLEEGQFQAVVDVLSGILEESPDDIELLNQRAGAYMKLANWQAADADYTRVMDLESDDGRRRLAERARAECRLRMGLFPESADVYFTESLLAPGDYYRLRDACTTLMLAGQAGIERSVALRLFEKFKDTTNPGQAVWVVRSFAAQPGLITKDNSQKLLQLARTAGGAWTETMAAAIHYRLGDLKQAEPLLTSSNGEKQYQALAAMLLYDQGKTSEARAFLKSNVESWFERERALDPASAIPAQQPWQEWGMSVAVWREAARKLIGPRIVELDELLAKDADSADERLERASLLADAGLNVEALDDLERLAALKIDSPEFHAVYGQVLVGLRRDDEALPHLNQAIAAGSQDAGAYAARGTVLLRQQNIEEARADLEKSLELHPTELAARSLADLLLAEAEKATNWTVLKPTGMKSEGGATLTLLDDDSILAEGKNPDSDTYRIVLKIPEDIDVTGIRVEALTHPSLPRTGPGRNPAGLFRMGSWKVVAKEPESPDSPRTFEFENVLGEYERSDNPFRPSGYWYNLYGPESPQRKTHATWTLSKPMVLNVVNLLTVEMTFPYNPQSNGPSLILGRFRLLVTDDSAVFAREYYRLKALSSDNPWLRLAHARLLNGDVQQAADSFALAFQRAVDDEQRKAIFEDVAKHEEVSAEFSKRIEQVP